MQTKRQKSGKMLIGLPLQGFPRFNTRSELNEVGSPAGEVAIIGGKAAVAKKDRRPMATCRLPRRFARTTRTVLAPVLLVGFCALAARPFRGGVVATAHPIASAAALSMLERGGNAVDASVAAAFTLAVVDPAHSGLGGGGFALLHDVRSGQTRVLDFRETAPSGASRDMFVRSGKVEPKLVTDGALAVAVPGAVAGYFAALSSYGTLKPSVVLAPAILAARRGFRVTPMYQRLAKARLDCLRSNPGAARIFLRPRASGERGSTGILRRQARPSDRIRGKRRRWDSHPRGSGAVPNRPTRAAGRQLSGPPDRDNAPALRRRAHPASSPGHDRAQGAVRPSL